MLEDANIYQDSDVESGIYEVKNLIIHGGKYRARQCGYGCQDTTKVWVTDIKDNPGPIEHVVHTELLGDDLTPVSVHGHGIPAFTMWLRVENFYFDKDGHIGATITRACMRRFPMYRVHSPDPTQSVDSIYSYDNIIQPLRPSDEDGTSVIYTSGGTVTVKQGTVPNEWRNPNSSHTYDNFPNQLTWGCPFNIFASIYYGNVNMTERVLLFKFPAGLAYWGDPDGVDSDTPYATVIGMDESDPITLQSSEPVSETLLLENRLSGSGDLLKPYSQYTDEEYTNEVIIGKMKNGDASNPIPVTLVVYNYSQCNCDQTNKNRPVFAADITQYIPDKKGYVWRRFGTSAKEDPEGLLIAVYMEKDPDEMLDGKWHLIRPFFYKAGDEWVDVERDVYT